MDPFANRRWDPVGGDAQVRGHVQATHFGDVQQLTVDHVNCGDQELGIGDCREKEEGREEPGEAKVQCGEIGSLTVLPAN